MEKSKRGRPLGFKLSKESKKAISESKKGQKHKQATKDKISKTLLVYFRNKNPLSEELINTYCRADDDDTCGWMNEKQESIDEINDVRTERCMINARKVELSYGQNIEYFSHDFTPETALLVKEMCDECGINIEDIFNSIVGGSDE